MYSASTISASIVIAFWTSALFPIDRAKCIRCSLPKGMIGIIRTALAKSELFFSSFTRLGYYAYLSTSTRYYHLRKPPAYPAYLLSISSASSQAHITNTGHARWAALVLKNLFSGVPLLLQGTGSTFWTRLITVPITTTQIHHNVKVVLGSVTSSVDLHFRVHWAPNLHLFPHPQARDFGLRSSVAWLDWLRKSLQRLLLSRTFSSNFGPRGLRKQPKWEISCPFKSTVL